MESQAPDRTETPKTAADVWAERRRKNLVIFLAVIGLGVLFFIITILRMS